MSGWKEQARITERAFPGMNVKVFGLLIHSIALTTIWFWFGFGFDDI